ncbi:hypothetical protein M0R45_031959 [Rubus argutus]|uniref:Jacalin-type lectin domain-containing protein n=1 Tax=Rubus argutus TaxID=59490 RepID=A0AAW1WG73_RUBAR
MFVTPTLSISCITCYWDDGVYHGVREITVASGLCIDSIRVAYDKDGELVNADKHGADGGSVNPQIKLEYPDEFLVSVSGNYFEAPWAVCNGRNPVVIRSLKFESNRRTFGPFGIEVGTPFSFTVEDGGQIIGMMGRSGLYLDAIGFHIAHAPKRKFFRRVMESLKQLWPSKAYDILIKIAKPLSIVQCTGISM